VPNTDCRHCAGKAAYDHILAVDTHINFSIERTPGKSWRGKSPYLSYYRLQSVRYLIYSWTHLSGSRSVYALPFVYKRESALVRTQGSQGPTSSRVIFPSFQAIQHTSGRRVLRSGGPNHSKSRCLFRIHPSFDQAFLDLPQTHPKLGLGGCIPPPGWRFPPTFGAPGRGS
jgi:hypothetical protein